MSGKKKRGQLGANLWSLWVSLIARCPNWLFAPEPKKMPGPPPKDQYLEEDFNRALENYKYAVEQERAFHDETSKTIRRVFYALVGTSLFCLITLLSKTDAALLASSAEVELPILNYSMEFGAFLFVGPLLLIALTIYLHIFVGQRRRDNLPKIYRQPSLPNFSGWTSKIVVVFIFYWMVPLTLAAFTWKAWPRPAGLYLFGLTLGFTAVMVWLQMRRSPRKPRAWVLPLLVIGYGSFAAGLYQITEDRNLNLFKADLSGQDLRGINLSNANLSEANLSEANLSFANLNGAGLKGANLNGADLVGAMLNCLSLGDGAKKCANLSFANLNGANLSRANLTGASLLGAKLNCLALENGEEKCANLRNVNLNGASLNSAELNGADLSGASLTGADLAGAQLNGANLPGAKLNCLTLENREEKCADLSRAELNGADLRFAELNGADLSFAKLYGADLYGADLSNVKLNGANLSGVDLTQIRSTRVLLSKAQLLGACGDEDTKLPWWLDLTIEPCPPEENQSDPPEEN